MSYADTIALPRVRSTPPPPAGRTRHRSRNPRRARLAALPWPLLAILGMQSALSLRLIWSNTAFIDEATYLYAGRQELAHWLHGTPVADYQTFFSGAPAIYPPIGALADMAGGLAAARLLGLGFVMGATILLYATARNLFDRRTAYLSTALFAALGVTQFLSAFATYDPMALFLLALSGYLVVGRRADWDGLGTTLTVTLAAPTVLALDNATKYATALWDPILIGLAVCAPVVAGRSWRYGLGVGSRFACVLGAWLAVGLGIGKQKYWQGILETTVARSAANNVGMNQPASLVLHDAWGWIGILLILTILGILTIVLTHWRGPLLALGVLLICAVVAAPLNQARIGTATSLQKHVVFGAWYGCILAGYGLRRVLNWRLPASVGILALLVGGASYYSVQATHLYQRWPKDNPAFMAGLDPLIHPGNQKYLMEDSIDIITYYVGSRASSTQWKNADRYSYVDPQTGEYLLDGPAFGDAIKRGVFTVIALDFNTACGDTDSNDADIVQDIKKDADYHIIGHLPPSELGCGKEYTVWALNGATNP